MLKDDHCLYWVFCLFRVLIFLSAQYLFSIRILSSVATEKALQKKDDFLWVLKYL